MKKLQKIVLTVSEKDLSNIKNKDIQLVDYIEIRLDLFSENFIKNKLEKKLHKFKKPVIFTIRKKKDSSLKQKEKISDKEIYNLLSKFNSKENFIDIELDSKSIFENFPNSQFSVIYSFHDFLNTISYKKMKSLIKSKKRLTEKCIFKFAVSPRNSTELSNFLKDVKILSKKYTLAAIAMGDIGILSRVFGDLYGSTLTYCCLKIPKAPGQISVDSLNFFRKDF